MLHIFTGKTVYYFNGMSQFYM